MNDFEKFRKWMIPGMPEGGRDVLELVANLRAYALRVALRGESLGPKENAPAANEMWVLEAGDREPELLRRTVQLFPARRLLAFHWICDASRTRDKRREWYCATKGGGPCVQARTTGRPTQPALRTVFAHSSGALLREKVGPSKVIFKGTDPVDERPFRLDADAKNWVARASLDYGAHEVTVGRPRELDYFQPFFTQLKGSSYLKVYIVTPGGSQQVQVTLKGPQLQALKETARLSDADDARLLNGYPDITRQFAESHRVLGPIGQRPEFRFVGLEPATCACRCQPFDTPEGAGTARRVGP